MKNKLVKEWVEKAEQDAEAVHILIRSRKRGLSDIICFHCQQAIEKYLKAYLTQKNSTYPKTHDLGKLLELASKHDGTMELIRDIIEPLTDYAISSRYPGEESDKSEVLAAKHGMERARKFCREKLVL